MIRKRKGPYGSSDIQNSEDAANQDVRSKWLFAARMRVMLLLGMIVALVLVFNQHTPTENLLRSPVKTDTKQAQDTNHDQIDLISSRIIHIESVGNRTIADHNVQIFPTINGCWDNSPRDFTKHPIFILASYVSGGSIPQKVDTCDVPCFYSRQAGSAVSPFADGYIDFAMIGGMREALQCPYAKAAEASMESPHIYPSYKLNPDRDYIAMTVELKSDVTVGYYSWVDYKLMDPVRPKTAEALAATFISNCGGLSGRGEVLEELMRHGVTSDNFGHCHRNKEEPPGGKVDILRSYKFGFAMENSIWQDYVTEKLFQVYVSGAVPIVVGAPNSHDYEPLPGSIIYDKDFDSIEDMAKHILYLASNDTAYNEYLRWKRDGPSDQFKALMDISAVHSRCRLCIKLADQHVEKYGDFHDIASITTKKNGIVTFLIRERNTFYFRPLEMNENELNIPAMNSAIFAVFNDRLPVWYKDRPAMLSNNTWKIYRVYRYIGAKQTMYDTLYNNSILIDSDTKLESLQHGSKLEVIFV